MLVVVVVIVLAANATTKRTSKETSRMKMQGGAHNDVWKEAARRDTLLGHQVDGVCQGVDVADPTAAAESVPL